MTLPNRTESPRLIFYELNEVPLKVVQSYIKNHKNSNLAKLAKSFICTTFTKDSGELHPWTTWPTVHRGVCNKKHKIQFLNQDLCEVNNKYPPIWHHLLSKGIDIGIFGSLQSYPPITGKNVKFYLPDTFSPSHEACPKSLREFQKFNLSMTGKNKAISGSVSMKDCLLFLRLGFYGFITLRVVISFVLQLLSEQIYPPSKTRRSFLQAIISFEVYFKMLRKHKPHFSTFFTNHVAGMMHRYWYNLYPEDFKSKPSFNPKTFKYHQSSIFSAMDIADKQIGKLMKYSQEIGADLWILSSMGQAAIERDKYIPELIVSDYKLLLNFLSLSLEDYQYVPAMQPDICFKCSSRMALEKLKSNLSFLLDMNKENILIERYEPVNLTVNFWFKRSKSVAKDKSLKYKNKTISLDKLGLSLINRDPGTGYHIPEGIALACGPNVEILAKQNTPIDTRLIYSLVKNLLLKK